MTTKFKIIISIFSILAFIFIIQSMANAVFPEGKVENFEEDENEKPIKSKVNNLDKEPKESKTPEIKKDVLSDQAIRMKVLEVIEEVFSEKEEYKKNASTNKPLVFDIIISDPINIQKLKNSTNIKDDIKTLIEKNMKNINPSIVNENTTSEKYEDDKVTEQTTNDKINHLNEIENKVQKIVNEGNSILEKIKSQVNTYSSKENFEMPPKLPKKLPNLIEGFESIRSYATF